MGVAVDLRIIKEIIKIKYPKVNQKIQGLGLDISVFMLEWMVCLFVTALPFSVSTVMFILALCHCLGSTFI